MTDDMQKWLEEYRAKDHSNDVSIELELDDDELAKLGRAAAALSMTFDEYCNYAIFEAVKEYKCPTCLQFRPKRSETCNRCGEID